MTVNLLECISAFISSTDWTFSASVQHEPIWEREAVDGFTKLSDCQNEWHKDRTAYEIAWFRSLSKWQIMSYANLVRKGEHPWEWRKSMTLPFDPDKNRYAAMSLETRMPHNFSTI